MDISYSNNNDDWFESYIRSKKMINELFDNKDSSSIYNNPRKVNHINSINGMMMRIKVLVDELNYIDTILKLKNLNEESLNKINQTLKNVEGALNDVKRASSGYNSF